jgi:hypothetical protein
LQINDRIINLQEQKMRHHLVNGGGYIDREHGIGRGRAVTILRG